MVMVMGNKVVGKWVQMCVNYGSWTIRENTVDVIQSNKYAPFRGLEKQLPAKPNQQTMPHLPLSLFRTCPTKK